jgi:hypothetical protein
MPSPYTRQQVKALEFFELEGRDPARLMLTRAPAAKTRNWLISRQLLEHQPVGQFNFRRYQLTQQGREALISVKHRPRRSTKKSAG